jgi:transposase
MIAKGLTVREAAIRLKIGKTTLYDAFRESGTQGASKTADNRPRELRASGGAALPIRRQTELCK